MNEPKLPIATESYCNVTDFINTMCEVLGKTGSGNEFLKDYLEIEGRMFDEGLYPEGYDIHIDAENDVCKPFSFKAEIISYMKRQGIKELTISERD